MPRSSPQPSALALVIAHLISQLRIAQGCQAVRRNELSLPRGKPLRIPCPSIVPLIRHAPRLVDPCGKHPLQVSLRSNQRLSQINYFPLLSTRSDQRPIPAHIFSRDPSRLPIPRPQQLPLSLVLHKLHRISILLFLTRIRRIGQLFPRRLSGSLPRTLRRSLPRLRALRPPPPRPHPPNHPPPQTTPPPRPPCPPRQNPRNQ